MGTRLFESSSWKPAWRAGSASLLLAVHLRLPCPQSRDQLAEHRMSGPWRWSRYHDLPQVFRTKSCLRDGLLGRGSHAQGAVYG